MLAVSLMIVGLLALVGGAELLVRGGSSLASRLGIAPMTIGLTVVAIGTSMPELAIGVDAARRGNAGLAVGNIVGTNLVNLLLILGLSALIYPIVIQSRTLRFDLPAMTFAALLVFVLGRDGKFTGVEGAVLILAGIGYTYVVLRVGKIETARVDERHGDEASEGPPPGEGSLTADVMRLLAGLVVIVVGADLMVRGAVEVATSLGVSDVIIGLTIVAIGTSAPELVTTLVSTFRGDRDLALGNLLGSSVYNLVFILGVTVLMAPGHVSIPDEVLAADLLLMTVVAVACVPVFMSGRRIGRLEGGIFVAAYAVYVVSLITLRS